MAINYPAALDTTGTTFPVLTDGVDDVLAAHQNDRAAAILALEAKVGIDSSAVTTSHEWLIKNAASIDPGHKHTLGALSLSGLTVGHALFASSATACGFRAIVEADIVDGAILARNAGNETIIGAWTFNGTVPAFKQGIKLGGAGSEAVSIAATSGAGTVTYTLPSTFTAGQFLQVGSGGVCAWATVSGGGGGGWQDDGTVVRLSTVSDQVAVGATTAAANSRLYVEAGSASDIPLVIKHAATPTGAFTEWRSSGGTPIASVTAAGGFFSKTTATAAAGLLGAAGAILGATNSTGHFFGVNIDTEANLFSAAHLALKIFGPSLNALFGDSAAATADIAAQLGVVSSLATKVATRIRGAASQSANILEVQDNSGASTYVSVSSAGALSTRALTTQAGFGITLTGATSGATLIKAPASGGTITYTLPPDDGSAGQVLATDGTGVLSWVSGVAGTAALSSLTAAAGGNTIANGANAQVWNWALGAGDVAGLTLGESVAASAGGNVLYAKALTTSTAYPLRTFHADAISGQAAWLEGGRTVMKTRYLTIGPGARAIPKGGDSVYQAGISLVGDLRYEIDGVSTNSATRRFCAIYTNEMRLMIPSNAIALNMFAGTTNAQSAVYCGMHCQFAKGSGGADYAGTFASYNLYGVDATCELGAGIGQWNLIVGVGGELNYNGADVGAAGGTSPEACFMAGHTQLESSTSTYHNLIGFYFRGNTGITLGQSITHNITNTSWTIRGLHINPLAVTAGFATAGAEKMNRQYRPISVEGHAGLTSHGPRSLWGFDYAPLNGAVLTNASLLNMADTSYPIPAAMIVASYWDGIGTSSSYRKDKFILCGIDTGSATNDLNVRFGFYAAGGMILYPQSGAPPTELGALYTKSSDSKLYFYNGSTWLDLTSGGGGGGWSDDGTTIRLVTATDKLVIGSSTSTLTAQMVFEIPSDMTAITIRRTSSQSANLITGFANNGTTVMFAVNADGALICSSFVSLRDTSGTTLGGFSMFSDGVNLKLGSTSVGTSAKNVIGITNATAPTSSPADSVQIYAKDAAAGKSWVFFRAEDGTERCVLGVQAVNTSLSTGVGSLKLTAGTSRDNTGYLQVHDNAGNIVYVPYFSNIA